LNGSAGTLKLFDAAAGRWTVVLADGGEKSIKPANLVVRNPDPSPEQLHEGQAVLIQRLESASARRLNGSAGTLKLFDAAAGRWIVVLADGEEKSIKPANLVVRKTEVFDWQ
jgi:predicted secreted protein